MTTLARRWKRTITLKDLLGPEDDGATVRRVAAEMYRRLAKPTLGYKEHGFDDFSSTVDEMRDIAESTPEDYADETWTIGRHFNACLNAIYDWADANRVWIA